jgi:peptidoglycan hydrolase CwlO-like protein
MRWLAERWPVVLAVLLFAGSLGALLANRAPPPESRRPGAQRASNRDQRIQELEEQLKQIQKELQQLRRER